MADWVPLPLLQSSYNKDVVVEKTAPPPFVVNTNVTVTSATLDAGTNNTGNAFYEVGFDAAAPATGLPAAGSVFTSTNDANHQFIMAPSYHANNAVLIDGTGSTNGDLAPITPVACNSLSFLTTAGNANSGAITINFTLQYQDGTTESGSFNCYDWYLGTQTAPVAAYGAGGRADVQSNALDVRGTPDPRLYQTDVGLANPTLLITNIHFEYYTAAAANTHAGIFAVSGDTNNSGVFVPIPVRGFNQDMIIEASVGFPGALTNVTTASMSTGTNNTSVTWYEVGYNTNDPTTGLPAAGSIFVNPNAPNHSYQMPPSYTTNCAIFVQTNPVISATVTLATPTACSNLSFLGASFGGNVTNRFFIHHTDGSTEQRTLTFFDWNTNLAGVYTNNGAINLTTRYLTNVNTGSPRLFAVDATVNNVNPIDTITVNFIHGVGTAGNSARTVFFAISGALINPGGGGGLSPFHITSEQQLSPSQFKLTFDSVAGTNYVILSKDSLTNAAWVTNGSLTAIGSSSTYTDTTTLGVPRRFYKIEAPQH